MLKSTTTYLISGRSMYPFLDEGDVVTIAPITKEKIGQNSIIAVKKDKTVIIHRVIYTTHRYVYTQGDNNDYLDPPSTYSQIIGEVCSIQKRGGTAKQTIWNKRNRIYQGRIRRIETLFHKKKIPLIILKGLPLYQWLNSSDVFRAYKDCDFLIDATMLSKARDVLKKEGFRELKKEEPYHHESTFYLLDNNYPIVFDIHLEIGFGIKKFDPLYELYSKQQAQQLTASLLNNARHIRIGKTVHAILKPEHLLLFLLVHLFRHNYVGVHRYGLISALLKKERIDFCQFTKLVESFGLNNYISPGVTMYNSLFSPKIPKMIESKLQTNKHITAMIKNRIKFHDILISQNSERRGVEKFVNSFIFSDSPFLKKLQIFSKKKLYLLLLHVLGSRIKQKVLEMFPRKKEYQTRTAP